MSNNTEQKIDVLSEEHQEFVRTSPEGMKYYLQRKIGVPDKTERFNWEDYEEDNPLLTALRNLGPAYISYLKKRCIGAALMGVGIGVIFALTGREEAIIAALFGIIAVVGAISLGGAIGWPIYKRKLALVENDLLWDVVFQENFKVWAVARYEFASVEDFEAAFQIDKSCYLETRGSKSGFLNSSITYDELPLKP